MMVLAFGSGALTLAGLFGFFARELCRIGLVRILQSRDGDLSDQRSQRAGGHPGLRADRGARRLFPGLYWLSLAGRYGRRPRANPLRTDRAGCRPGGASHSRDEGIVDRTGARAERGAGGRGRCGSRRGGGD